MRKQILFLAVAFVSYLPMAMAVPAYPFVQEIVQPDGTTLHIQIKGDEFHHYTITDDGVLITKNGEGIYEYATIDNLSVVATGVKAKMSAERSDYERAMLSTLNSDVQQLQVVAQQSMLKATCAVKSEPQKLKGNMRSLVILVNYSDVSFSVSNPQQSFYNLLNQTGYSGNGAIGSARDYYIAASDSQFVPTFDVYGPYTLPNTRSYYGGNTSRDDDSNPRQMVTDACDLADADVDFSLYDYDGDGYVDNVFIYYAGHNEAEGGPASSVWPHRWVVGSNTRYDGKRLYDYACTSELRGYTGTSMCGIGTFVHEFGHVLGLPDMYITDYGSSHKTLESWSVMDYGAYLNNGRTPCSYSAYERFYLDWLTPTILDDPTSEVLPNLLTDNRAFLISQSGTHNLDGQDPNPTQFFMLENRQKSSWDQYLPGHGMLITLINYSSYTWSYNTVNNDPNSMGVDLIEANNNSSSVSGADPFPGTSNVTSYVPRLRNGTLLSDKELTNITESSGVIYFDFAGGATTFLRYTGNVRDFSVYDNAISETQKVALIGNGLIDSVEFSFVYGNHFDILSPDSQWVKHMKLNDSNGQLRADLSIRYNPLNFGSHSDRLMITSPDALPIYIDVHGVNRDKTALEDLTNTLVYVITTSSEWQIYAEDQGEYEVSLYTITGQRLFSTHFVGSVNVENASHARGVYLLEMRQMSTGKKQIIKVVR